MFRTAGENTNTIFPGPVSEWTPDQRRLATITKEYANAYSTMAIRKHDPPGEHIMGDYNKFREWWDLYARDPEIGDNPYEKYSHGFSLRR